MAYLRAFSSFDIRDINLNKLISGQISWEHISNANVIFDQKLYQDVSIFEYYYEGYATGIFGGRDITYSLFPGGYYKPISGTVTGYVQLNGGKNSTDIMWYVSGFEHPATEFSNAAFTSDTSDDFQIISNILSGNDLLELSDLDDVAAGYNGNDEIWGGRGSDDLYGLAGNDKIYGGPGFDFIDGGQGADYLDGGGDVDYVYYGEETSGVIVNLVDGVARTASGDDTLVSIEGVFGSPFSDKITGDQYQNVFFLTSGQDVVRGGGAQFGDIIAVAGSFSEYLVTQNTDGSFNIKKPSDSSVDTTLFDITKIYSEKEGVTKELVTLLPNTAPYFSGASQSVSTIEDTAKAVTLAATDADSDSLTYTAATPANGTVSVSGSVVTYTPKLNFNGADSFVVTASDGKGGTATQTVSVAVAAVNDAPTFSASSQSVAATAGTAKTVTLAATDVDGDTLTYTVATPGKGAATVSGTTLTYTPAASATGSDSFVVTASDGKGGTATQTIAATIAAISTGTSSAVDFRMSMSDGWTGTVGGNGQILGSSGFQDIRILSGTVTLDASFNRGGDVIRLPDAASSYTIARSGSSAQIGNAGLTANIPVGTSGLATIFADGVRKLVFSGGNFNIGSQAFSASASITAGTDNSTVPTGADNAATARISLSGNRLAASQTAHVTIGGTAALFGTSSNDVVALATGAKSNLTFDASFNRGGDAIILGKDASSFSAVRSGSSIVLTTTDQTLNIPVGTSGLTLKFTDGDRSLAFTGGVFKIGDQTIEQTSTALTSATITISLDVGTDASRTALSGSSGAVIFTDNATVTSNVRISGFGRDDVIRVTGATESQYSFSTTDLDNDGSPDDLSIVFNAGSGVVNDIQILNVVSSSDFVFDSASAIKALGFNFITFG